MISEKILARVGLLAIVLVLAPAFTLWAQDVRLNLYSAYAFDDYFEVFADNSNYFNGTIEGGYQWGAGVEYILRESSSLELVYHRQDTHAPTFWANGSGTGFSDLDFNINYIMLGGNRLVRKPNGKAELYGGLMLGVGIASVSSKSIGSSESVTKFSWGLKLGGTVWASERFGIKLQALLLSAVQAAGGSVYVGSGGSGAGVNSYSTLYQFSLGGGLSYRLTRWY